MGFAVVSARRPNGKFHAPAGGMSADPMGATPSAMVRINAVPQQCLRCSSRGRILCGTIFLMGVLVLGCAREEVSTPAPAAAGPAVSQRYVGCIGPTADAKTFVVSVAEGRDFTTGEPPGTPIPQTSELPEGAPPPNPPVTVTSGTPGGGPTPTTKIVTYRLLGDGGKNLQEHVGHTVEILAALKPPDDHAASTASGGTLVVTSLRDLADYCK